MMSTTFSSRLVKDNIVPIHKMDEALQRQIIFGGRLGTNLLEIGAITELELTQYLAISQNIRPAQLNHFTNIDPDAIQLLDIETIEHLKMLPIRVHPGNQIDVLVIDPLDNNVLTNLHSKTGFTLTQFIAPEFRFFQALELFFERTPHQRYLRLIKRFPQPITLGVPSKLGSRQSTSSLVNDYPATQKGATTQTWSETTLGRGWSREDIDEFLKACYSRDTTLELTLGVSGRFAQRRALFVITKRHLHGYLCAGFGDHNKHIRQLKIPITPDGLLFQLCQGDKCYQGEPDGIMLDALYTHFGLEPPEQVVIIPIKVGPRAGLILVLDNNNLYFSLESINDLFKIIPEVSSNLERIIKLMKRNELPPQELRTPPIPARYQKQRPPRRKVSQHSSSDAPKLRERPNTVDSNRPQTQQAFKPVLSSNPTKLPFADNKNTLQLSAIRSYDVQDNSASSPLPEPPKPTDTLSSDSSRGAQKPQVKPGLSTSSQSSAETPNDSHPTPSLTETASHKNPPPHILTLKDNGSPDHTSDAIHGHRGLSSERPPEPLTHSHTTLPTHVEAVAPSSIPQKDPSGITSVASEDNPVDFAALADNQPLDSENSDKLHRATQSQSISKSIDLGWDLPDDFFADEILLSAEATPETNSEPDTSIIDINALKQKISLDSPVTPDATSIVQPQTPSLNKIEATGDNVEAVASGDTFSEDTQPTTLTDLEVDLLEIELQPFLDIDASNTNHDLETPLSQIEPTPSGVTPSPPEQRHLDDHNDADCTSPDLVIAQHDVASDDLQELHHNGDATSPELVIAQHDVASDDLQELHHNSDATSPELVIGQHDAASDDLQDLHHNSDATSPELVIAQHDGSDKPQDPLRTSDRQAASTATWEGYKLQATELVVRLSSIDDSMMRDKTKRHLRHIQHLFVSIHDSLTKQQPQTRQQAQTLLSLLPQEGFGLRKVKSFLDALIAFDFDELRLSSLALDPTPHPLLTNNLPFDTQAPVETSSDHPLTGEDEQDHINFSFIEDEPGVIITPQVGKNPFGASHSPSAELEPTPSAEALQNNAQNEDVTPPNDGQLDHSTTLTSQDSLSELDTEFPDLFDEISPQRISDNISDDSAATLATEGLQDNSQTSASNDNDGDSDQVEPVPLATESDLSNPDRVHSAPPDLKKTLIPPVGKGFPSHTENEFPDLFDDISPNTSADSPSPETQATTGSSSMVPMTDLDATHDPDPDPIPDAMADVDTTNDPVPDAMGDVDTTNDHEHELVVPETVVDLEPDLDDSKPPVKQKTLLSPLNRIVSSNDSPDDVHDKTSMPGGSPHGADDLETSDDSDVPKTVIRTIASLANPDSDNEMNIELKISSDLDPIENGNHEFPSLFDEITTAPPEMPRINSDGQEVVRLEKDTITSMIPQPFDSQGISKISAVISASDLQLIDNLAIDLEAVSQDDSESNPFIDPAVKEALSTYRPVVERLNSANLADVKAATDTLIASQGMALPALLEKFPGPILFDHHAYTISKLPPIEQHGPLLNTLVQMGSLAAPAICTFFDHQSNLIRFYTILYFARTQFEPAVLQIYRRIFDKDSRTRNAAIHTIRRYKGSPGYRDALHQLYQVLSQSQDPWHLEQAALTFGSLGEVRAIPQLLTLMDHKHSRVSDSAHRSLCQLAYEDFGQSKRKWNKWWQNNSDGDRKKWLIRALNHNKDRVREIAAEELQMIPGLIINYSPYGAKQQRTKAQTELTLFFRQNRD